MIKIDRVVIFTIICLLYYGCPTSNEPIICPGDISADMAKEKKQLLQRAKKLDYNMDVDEIKSILGEDTWGNEYKVFFYFDENTPCLYGEDCKYIIIYSPGRDGVFSQNFEDYYYLQFGNDDIRCRVHICETFFSAASVQYDDLYLDNPACR